MVTVSISSKLRDSIPDFRVGVIVYHQLTVTQLPAIIAEKLPLYYQNIQLSLETQPIASIPGVHEWRALFKKAGSDPSRYRPSQEALLRKIARDGAPHSVNSAVDLNNFFSVQHSIPMGIYDLDTLKPPVIVTIGSVEDSYNALNGRIVNIEDKLTTIDQIGAFGSPIVDSKRSCITTDAKNALQIVYLRPSMSEDDAAHMLQKIAEMFVQVHGGDSDWSIVR